MEEIQDQIDIMDHHNPAPPGHPSLDDENRKAGEIQQTSDPEFILNPEDHWIEAFDMTHLDLEIPGFGEFNEFLGLPEL